MPLDNNSNIAIIIPAKNEGQTIGGVLDKILLRFYPDNVIVIVDDMRDDSVIIAQQRKVRVLRNNKRGKGGAIRFAIDNVNSDILVFIDADGSHDPEDIPKLIQPIIAGKADLVIASRIKGGSEEFSGSIENSVHYIGNRLSAFITNLFWNYEDYKITDCQNGFRAIRNNTAIQLDLREDTSVIEQEMTIQCLKKGFRIDEIPSYEFKRQYGKPRINAMNTLPRHILYFIISIFDVFKYLFSRNSSLQKLL